MSAAASAKAEECPRRATDSGDRFVDLLRHGETIGGARFRGVQDDRLSAVGWAQMEAAVQAGSWDGILSSPARRCAAFAEDLAARLGVPLEVWPDLGERHFGSWEGRAAAEIPLDELCRFWADPVGFTPPGGEPFTVMQQRCQAAWQRLLACSAEHPLVVTHGGIVRVLLGEVLGVAANRLLLIEVPHASLSRLRVPAEIGYPSLVRHGVRD